MSKIRRPDRPQRAHAGLSHIAAPDKGRGSRTSARFAARMVDVGAKPVSARVAIARAEIVFPRGVLAFLLAGTAGQGGMNGPKGPIEEVARTAGILAAKRTGELVPMCHPIGLDVVEIAFAPLGPDRLEIRCRTACRGRTGVEMEAMVGVSVAALTVYDMTKALDPAIAIERVELVEKQGGKSGVWRQRAAGAGDGRRPRKTSRDGDEGKR